MNLLRSMFLAGAITAVAIAGVVSLWLERKMRNSRHNEQIATEGPPFEWLQQ